MLRAIDSETMGRGQHGWLDSHFHFSFAEYYNPENINFGVLRVVNDDIVLPGRGFDIHPHQDMEIISYVLEGNLTHGDSMGNEKTITRGEAQYMSAGTGVLHSEYNHGEKPLRFFQTWILPDKKSYEPNYGDHQFKWEDRINKWLPMATWTENKTSNAPIKIHADVNVYSSYLESGKELKLEVAADRQAYLVLAEGKLRADGIGLKERDAMEITSQDVTLEASEGENAHIYVIEMALAE
jgi:redox-sensitive bicupin YhaK (pirin superfamily)